jgi:hypothetical protein
MVVLKFFRFCVLLLYYLLKSAIHLTYSICVIYHLVALEALFRIFYWFEEINCILSHNRFRN